VFQSSRHHLLLQFKYCNPIVIQCNFIGLDYIKCHLKDQDVERQSENSHSSEELDFFSAVKHTSCQGNAKKLETYLGCPADTVEVLKFFPPVCNLSLRLNTALPASAACERLFSTAGLIFTSKRTHTDSKNFENQILLWLTKAFWQSYDVIHCVF